jgi:hypothetical protein
VKEVLDELIDKAVYGGRAAINNAADGFATRALVKAVSLSSGDKE